MWVDPTEVVWALKGNIRHKGEGGEGGRGRVTLQKTTAQFADLEDLEFLSCLSPFFFDGLVLIDATTGDQILLVDVPVRLFSVEFGGLVVMSV